MSLLLDALKSTDSGAALPADLESVGPRPGEQDEEPLDAQATLRLLTPKANQNALALEPVSGITTDPSGAAAPEIIADAAPAAPTNAARIPEGIAGRAVERAAAPVAIAAAPAAAGATMPAPSAAQRTTRYGLAIVMLAALAVLGTVGKSLWWSGTNVIVNPAEGDLQQATAAQPPTPAADAVQVSSGRPPNRFGYSGNAPEIDLHDAGAGTQASAAIVRPAAGARTPVSATQRVSTAAGHAAAALSVTRSDGSAAIDRHLQTGYQALAAGNLAGARDEYLAALEIDPNNVDALMGTATAAARGGRPGDADAAYAQVLQLEPGNPDAIAAKAMLAAHGSTGEAGESRLKVLIASGDGGRPALHAALAGVYAADSRWGDAAQEYFTALGKDPGNPDLAFNVAASLDQNRNLAMALNYYRQALAFAHQRATQIDLRAVEQRITQLQVRLETPTPSAAETP